MKTLLRYILSIVLFALFPVEVFGLSISELRLQERQLALVDFKNIYKERKHFKEQRLKKVKRKRTKTMQHNNLFNHAGKQSHAQEMGAGPINSQGAFNGMSGVYGAENSANMPPTQGGNMSDSVGQRPISPWGKKP